MSAAIWAGGTGAGVLGAASAAFTDTPYPGRVIVFGRPGTSAGLGFRRRVELSLADNDRQCAEMVDGLGPTPCVVLDRRHPTTHADRG